ncbi:Radical SAM superfamily protein [Lentzea fradiae]|uniref:Radical SAM superfamily protein n=1 Tax=Lentzea fradiae TaxID=200378 RepID=A0A1G8AWY2_9PSEU|nr:radical SAM protein [Lentzea fradiae]SDH25397.1 Radical SAM superfamily protein [Lentzea fradiae]
MHALIASPFLTDYLVLKPDDQRAVKIGSAKFGELLTASKSPNELCPQWLVDAARQRWDVDIAGEPLAQAVKVREPSLHGFGRASYEVNLGCNYDCEHCYLGLKQFSGLEWPDRERVLEVMHDAGVLWLQITGGEATVDRLFPQVYARAWDYGMMITVATNGSRLASKPLLDLFSGRRPYRLTVSVYGATEESYDGLTRRRGSFKAFSRGIAAAREAGLPLNLSLVITRHNAHELDEMRAFAENLGVSYATYSNISPTIYGGGETLISQATEFPRKRTVFAGCGAGHTHFATDPHGKATICKIGRDEHVSLLDEGLDGLTRLGEIADALQLRTGGCSGCALSGTCSTCRPLAKLYQEAKAPLSRYCQHGEEGRS